MHARNAPSGRPSAPGRSKILTILTLRPRTYPRVLKNEPYASLAGTSAFLGVLATVAVLVIAGLVYTYRAKRTIRTAQVEFLYLLLAGLFLVATGAVTASVATLSNSDSPCIISTWLINLGYTMALVPLLVKVAAINRLNSAARSFRRVVLTRKRLFRNVHLVNIVMILYLTIWTALDRPRQQAEYDLSDQITSDDETIVNVRHHCSSRTVGWTYGVIGWQGLLLLSASVLAFQTRKVQKDFNESHTLALMIYSHVLFVILRVICVILMGDVGNAIFGLLLCLIFSVDTLATLCIYFLPKLIRRDVSSHTFNRSSVMLAEGAAPTFRGLMVNGHDQNYNTNDDLLDAMPKKSRTATASKNNNNNVDGSLVPTNDSTAVVNDNNGGGSGGLDDHVAMSVEEEDAEDVNFGNDAVLTEEQEMADPETTETTQQSESTATVRWRLPVDT